MKRPFFFRTDEINPDGIAPFREPYWERRHRCRRAFLSTTATRRQGCRRSQCVEDQPRAWFVRMLRLVLSHTAALQLSGA